MLLETLITHKLDDYEPCLLIEARNELIIEPAKKYLERFLLDGSNVSISILQMQYTESIPMAIGRSACSMGSWFRFNHVDSNAALAVLLESGRYTQEQLLLVSSDEFDMLLDVIFVMPQQAIDDIFQYHTYRKADVTYSLYDNIIAFQEEQYRISDHWNLKIKKKNGRTKIAAPTTDKIKAENHFKLGKKVDKKWEIIKDYGASIERTQEEKNKVIEQIGKSGIFKGNSEVRKYIKDYLNAFN